MEAGIFPWMRLMMKEGNTVPSREIPLLPGRRRADDPIDVEREEVPRRPLVRRLVHQGVTHVVMGGGTNRSEVSLEVGNFRAHPGGTGVIIDPVEELPLKLQDPLPHGGVLARRLWGGLRRASGGGR